MRFVLGIGLLAATLLGSACRFEKRPDLRARQAADTTLYLGSGAPSNPAEDSVRAVITALNDAFRMGDITRVAQLTTADVVLIDQEDEVYWTRANAQARLPRALRGEDKLGWESTGSTIADLGDSQKLATLRFGASVSGESVPWTAVESWLLVRTDQGWRLRYLHRSRGLGRTAPRP